MKYSSILSLSFFILLLTSCSSKVDIFFPSKFVNDNEVMINEKFNLKDYVTNNEYSKVNLSNGEIHISINGIKSSFETDEGGLLNLEGNEFVIFPVYYQLGDQQWPSSDGMPRPILVDSFVFYNNKMFHNLPKETYINIALANDKKKFDPTTAKNFETTKINKGDFFIEKVWEINLDEIIAENISVNTSSETTSMIIGKKTIRTAKEFAHYAIASGNFAIIDLRNEGKTH